MNAVRWYEFGPFRLDATKRVLWRNSVMLALTPRQIDILLVLVEQRGELVEKDDLMRRVWADSVVEEGNLPVNVHALRKALGDSRERSQFIQTVPRRGYRFAAPVIESDRAMTSRSTETAERPGIIHADADTLRHCDPVAPFEPGANSPQATPAPRRWRTVYLRPGAFGLVSTAIVLAVLALASIGAIPSGEPVSAPPAVRSIAVLPFSDTRSGPGGDPLGALLSESMASGLGRHRELIVRPSTASGKFPSGAQDAAEAGRALQVDAVLEGRVRDDRARMLVELQLIRVSDGARLWTNGGESFGGLEYAHHDLVRKVALALGLDPDRTDTARRPVDTPIRSAQAHLLYLKGRHLCNQGPPRTAAMGLTQLEAAIELDPTLADAHAALATCLVQPVATAPNIEKMPRVKAMAMRALELDSRLAGAHSARAYAGLYSDWDWAGARRHFQRAVELGANDAQAHQWYAMFYSARGQHEQALDQLRLARRIDPSSSRLGVSQGYALYMARRFDHAIDQFRRTPLELGPTSHQVLWGLGLAHLHQGNRREALESLRHAMVRTGNHPAAKAHLAYAYAKLGDAGEAARILADPDLQQAPALLLAATYACLGNTDRSFNLLATALDRRDYRVLFVGVDPLFDCLRTDARFMSHLNRIGLGKGNT